MFFAGYRMTARKWQVEVEPYHLFSPGAASFLMKHSSQTLCWTVSSNVVSPVWTWHSKILGHTDSKQADPWNQKGARSRIAQAIFQISIILETSCLLFLSGKSCQSLMIYSTKDYTNLQIACIIFPFPPQSFIPIFDHHTRCGSKVL